MRAVRFDRYGPPDVLHVADVERPVPKAGEVLVRIHAASATRTDCGLRGAEYLIARVFTGLLRPRDGRVGIEFAGEVVAVGDGVTTYAVGDRLFGICDGGNAEYVAVAESAPVARIPDGLPYVEAAGLADGALSALSLLRSAAVESGDRVLVYGASGSIGVGGVQVAKSLGANVTAVCPTKDVDLMRALGADEVVSYETDDFTKNGETYDVVFDAAGKATYLRCRRSVRRRYVTTDPGFLWHDAWVALFSRKAKLGIVRYTKEDVETLTAMLAAGTYRPVVDRTYPLEEVVAAHRYVETHQKTGNVVLVVLPQGE